MANVMQSTAGPIRTVLDAQGGALALFLPNDRSKIIKRGMREMGNMWLFKWMPLRFTAYAYKLGYRRTRKWANKKQNAGGKDIPFVGMTPIGGGPAFPTWKQINGEKMQVAAVKFGRVTASGSGGAEMVTIKVPYGHAILPGHSEVFKFIPPNEMEDMAIVLARRIANEIAGAAYKASSVAYVAARKENAAIRGSVRADARMARQTRKIGAVARRQNKTYKSRKRTT